MKKLFWLTLVVLAWGTVSAQPVYKLRVMYWSCLQGSPGVWVAKGSVYNQSGEFLRNIRVNLRVRDGKGVVMGTNSALIASSSLARAQSSRFEVVVRSKPGATGCQIWFRNDDVIQIPTRVPALKP